MYSKVAQSIIVCFAFGFILELPTSNRSGLLVGSIVPLLLGLLYAVVLLNTANAEKPLKEKICINGLSFAFTLFYTLSQIEVLFDYDQLMICLVAFGVAFGGLFLFFRVLIERIVFFLQKDLLVIREETYKYNAIYIFFGVFIILLLVWGISLAIFYPGFFYVDSLENLEQAIGARNMDVLFPFYMTLFLRLCWNVGLVIWGNGNAGIALYCAVQMVIMALAVSYMIYRLYKCNVKMPFCLVTLAYFVFVPYHAHISIMLLKDAPYAIGTLVFVQLMWEYYILGEPAKKYQRYLKCALFVAGGAIMALARANGYYAFVFCVPFVVVLFWKQQKRVVGYMVIMLAVIMFLRGPVVDHIISSNNYKVSVCDYPAYDVRYKEMNNEPEVSNGENSANEIEKQEVSNASSSYGTTGIFIITAQQLARVAVDRQLDADEYAKLDQIINVEKVREEYNPYIVTNAMQQIRNWDATPYLKTWIEFGLKYPYTYFMAWRDQTSGYWDPIIYSGGFDMDFWSKNPEVFRDSLVSEAILDKCSSIYEWIIPNTPVVSLLLCNGFALWVFLLAMIVTIIKRNVLTVAFYTPFIGLWLTLLIVNPCNASFRFMYPFFLCMPILLIIPFIRGQYERLEEK